MTLSIAYFVTPHGYGHAARSLAVAQSLRELNPDAQIEFFTSVPHWFFAESLAGPFGYHPLLTDVGMVQQDALLEDIPATLAALRDFLPFDATLVDNLAHQLKTLGCQLVVCDIAPLGIAVAKAARLPAVLVENFTWDWIYEGYSTHRAEFAPFIAYLQKLVTGVDYHLQTEPLCQPSSRANLTVGPVSRIFRESRSKTRQRLGLPLSARVVLMSMGGTPWDYHFLDDAPDLGDVYFVVAGSNRQIEGHKQLMTLPRQAAVYHPDLVRACDAIVGKVGYSTLAEVYQAGIPYGYIPRPVFGESPYLVRFIEAEMAGVALAETEFVTGAWVEKVPVLLAMSNSPSGRTDRINGAREIARFLVTLRETQ